MREPERVAGISVGPMCDKCGMEYLAGWLSRRCEVSVLGEIRCGGFINWKTTAEVLAARLRELYRGGRNEAPDGRWWVVSTRDSYQLCYADSDGSVYFANCPPSQVDGEDWGKAPHGANGHEPGDNDAPAGLFHVYHESGFRLASRDLSARLINRGAGPWLTDLDEFDPDQERITTIPAGTTYRDFKRLVREDGGTVFEALTEGGES